MATYRQGDSEAHAMIDELIANYHGSLQECGVRVGVLFAYAPRDEKTGETKSSALVKHGLPVTSTARVVSQKDRVAGLPDAQIIVDGEAWERVWNDRHKYAVLDRQLLHLEVQLDEEGNVKLDDCCRPKLRLVPPDYLLSGFRITAERYGDDSLEVQEARNAKKTYGDAIFDK